MNAVVEHGALAKISNDLHWLKVLYLEQVKKGNESDRRGRGYSRGGYRGVQRGSSRGYRGGNRGSYRGVSSFGGNRGRGRGGGQDNRLCCHYCAMPGHFIRDCYKKRADEEADARPHCATVTTSGSAKGGGGAKLPTWASLTIVCCLVNVVCVSGLPEQPLLCGKGEYTDPVLWNLPGKVDYSKPNTTSTNAPRKINIEIYTENKQEWKSVAY